MPRSLIDAGPLTALFDRNDRYHEAVKAFLQNYRGGLVTSWAVITEVMYMLDFDVRAQLNFLEWLRRDALEIPVFEKTHISRIIELAGKYADVPMDFADATLMVLSEAQHISNIITIDSDFYAYRDAKNHSLNNIFKL